MILADKIFQLKTLLRIKDSGSLCKGRKLRLAILNFREICFGKSKSESLNVEH